MVDQIIVAVYLVGILALGLWSGRDNHSLKDFSVSSQNYPWFIVFATLSASFIGGGFSIGNAEKVFVVGFVNVFALWGFSAKEMLVARFIAPRMSAFPDAISVGDLMADTYGKSGQVLSGFFSMALCAGIVGAQVGGIGLVFEVFLGMSKLYGILIGCGIVIAYSTVGGMKAVIYTDVIQFVVLVIGLPITLILGISHVGGWSAIVEAVPAAHFTWLGPKTWIAFGSLFLTFLLGETLVPPYVQRLLIGKSTQETVKGTYASGILSIPFFLVTGAIGLVAYTMDANMDPNTAMPFVIHTVLPVGLKGIVIMGIVSIVMSSADSFLNGASVAFVNDILQPLSGKTLSDKSGLRWVMGTNLVVGLASVIFAISIPSILDILIYAYNFWAPTILVPLAWAIFGKRSTPSAMVCASILGVGSTFTWNAFFQGASGVDGLIIGTLINASVMILFYQFTSAKGKTA